MDERDPVDIVGPWTIKAVATATRNAVNAAARRENLTVGQWLERRVTEWEAEGGPVPATPAAPINLGDLAHVMQSARDLAAAAGVAVPPQLARDALGMVRLAIRQAKGLPPPRPRQPPQRLIE